MEITFGRHRGVFDGERAVITVHGVVTESDAAQMMDFILRWDARAGNLGMVLRAPESFSVTRKRASTLSGARGWDCRRFRWR